MDSGSVAGLDVSGDLRDYLRPLRRHLLSIALCGLVFLLAAFVLVKPDPRVYGSQARVLVGEGIVGNVTLDTSDKLDLVTEQSVVASSAVAEPARVLMEVDTPAQALLGSLTVGNPRDSQILVIGFTSRDPEVAQLGAQSFADAYLAYRAKVLSAQLEARRAQLNGQVIDLGTQLGAANDIVSQTEPNSSAQNAAISRRDVLQTQIKTVNDALFALDGATVRAGSIIAPAGLPGAPQNNPRSDRLVYLAVALAVGLALGAAGAYARDALDHRISSSDTLERRFGLPVIGLIPLVRDWRRTSAPPLASVHLAAPDGSRTAGRGRPGAAERRVSADAMVAEDLRVLRAAFLYVAERTGVRVVLISSACDGEGKSTIAANLAASLAAVDRRVVLISADLWAPSLHATFGLAESPGLVEGIIDDLPLQQVIHSTAVPGLEVVPSRPYDVGETDLIGSPAVRRLFETARQRADFVIIDGAPLVVSDSLTLARIVDGVILVVDASTRRDALARAMEKLGSTGATVLAAVLNRYQPSRSAQDSGAYYEELRRRRNYLGRPSAQVDDPPDSSTSEPDLPLPGAEAGLTSSPQI
ncbi:MAG: polysaccharide biosynthesis tyrosine autokinase [Acidimicrobiales bacterium]